MTCISSADAAAIRTEIAELELTLVTAQASYDSVLTGKIKSYSLDTGEAKQSTTRMSPKELRSEISYLKARISQLYRKLNGTGIINLNVRRKTGVC